VHSVFASHRNKFAAPKASPSLMSPLVLAAKLALRPEFKQPSERDTRCSCCSSRGECFSPRWKGRPATSGPPNAPRLTAVVSAVQEKHRERHTRRVQKVREGKRKFKPPSRSREWVADSETSAQPQGQQPKANSQRPHGRKRPEAKGQQPKANSQRPHGRKRPEAKVNRSRWH